MRLAPGAHLRAVLTGTSLWLALGLTCTIVESGAVRVAGLLPPLSLLGLSIAAAAVLMTRTGAARVLPWPLAALTFLIVAAAWLPLPAAPSLHAWSGPASLILFALLGAVVARASGLGRSMEAGAALGPWLASAAACLWIGGAWWALGGRGVSGDEPHYLLIAQSVLADGDVDLRNNYDARDYLAYFPGVLEPRHVSLGVLGQEFSFHGPGVSLLALPAFAAGGAAGARLFLALLVACSSGLLWSAVYRLTRSASSAWIGWAALVCCAPLTLNATLIYPDAPAAAITAIALWALIRTVDDHPPSPAVLAFVGCALATLPWLHLRLSIVAAAFGLALLAALWGHSCRVSRIGALFAAPAVSAGLLFGSTWVMFDTLDPTAVFRQKAAGSLAALPAGLLGLLADQEYGLLPWAPYFAVAPLALHRLWPRHPVAVGSVAAAAAGTTLVAASWVWWGGQSAPARFLVPILPMLAAAVAIAWNGSGPATRALIAMGLSIAACLTTLVAVADAGAYAINNPDGRSTLFEWLSPSLDLSSAMPSLFRDGATAGSEAWLALYWMASAALVGAALTAWGRWRTPPTSRIWAASAASTIIGLSMTVAAIWSWRGVSPWTPDRAQLELLLSAGAGRRPIAVMSPGPRLVSMQELVSTLSIAAPRPHPPAALLHVPFVPAGRYRIEVEPDVSHATPPRFVLELGRDAWPFVEWDPSREPPPAFVLPFPLWAVRVTSPGADAGNATGVRLRPIDVAGHDGGMPPLAWTATRYGDLVVYSLDRGSFPERGGLWLGGDRDVALAISDVEGFPRAARLQLEAGPSPVRVDVSNEHGWRVQVALEPGARETIDVSARAGGAPRPLRFRVGGGFAPGDGRWLGVWVSASPGG